MRDIPAVRASTKAAVDPRIWPVPQAAEASATIHEATSPGSPRRPRGLSLDGLGLFF
jgi:hypothetical protein